MRPLTRRWVSFFERRHRAVVLGSVLLAVACALSLTRLKLDIDVLNMLPQGSPAFDEFKSFVSDFGELNQLAILVDGADLPHLERFADDMAERLRQLDSVSRVQARIEVDQLFAGLLGERLWSYIPEDAYAEIARQLTPEAIDARVAVNRKILSAPFDLTTARSLAQDPLGFRRLAGAALLESYSGAAPEMSSGYFAASDGRALLIVVRPVASGFDLAFSERFMGEVRQAAESTRAALGEDAHGIRAEYTGSYVYALEDAATLKWDIGRYTILALVGVLAVFYAGYRSLRILPFVAYPLLLNTLITFALSLLLFRELNAVSLCFAAILYGLSIDSMIYYYTRLLEERRAGKAMAEAVGATLEGLALPDFTSSITTAAAFFAIGTSALTAVRQFGLLTAVGMVGSAVLFFVLYPALSFSMAKSFDAAVAPTDTRRLEAVAHRSVAHARAVAAAFALLAVALFFPARRVNLDVALTHLRPGQSEAVRVQDEIAARFGVQQASGAVVVRAADLDAALAASEAIARRLRAYRDEGSVRSVQSIDGALPSLATQRARLQLFDALPRQQAAEALRQSLARHGFAPQKFAAFLESFTAPRGEGDVVVYGDPELEPIASLVDHHVRFHGGEYLVATYVEPAPGAHLADIESRLRRDLPGVAFGLASRVLLEDELARVLRRELTWFTVAGIAGNLVLLLIAFRSLGVAYAIVAPVVLVVLALFAFMAAAGIALDPVNLIVTPLLFGVGVDYGVYVAARARESGIATALRLSGRPLVASALTTVAGFGFLAFSRYPFLANMGQLAGVGLFLCLLLAIVLVPALLALVGQRE